MTTAPEEHCFVCEESTGHAGKGDGSLYDTNGDGPYCPRCFSWLSEEKPSPEDDIVFRLRAMTSVEYGNDGQILEDAADEIERLRAAYRVMNAIAVENAVQRLTFEQRRNDARAPKSL